ncbi:MAG: hypothetical protein ACRCZZ_02770 [Phocaeicola sp.]
MNSCGNRTIGKLSENGLVEDSSISIAEKQIIAVCDGAGGCGIFADEWSQYLIDHLPNKPLKSFSHLCSWLEAIWNPFFLAKQSQLAQSNNFVQNKFYDEGSYSTLAAIWKGSSQKVHWTTFGDSACFAYDLKREKLHLLSHKELDPFTTNPHLINWKEEPSVKGFKSGKFTLENRTLFFVTSDALACYLIAAYKVIKRELPKEIAPSLLEQLSYIQQQGYEDVYKDLLQPLLESAQTAESFTVHISQLYKRGEINNDDYSFAWMIL